MLLGEYEHTLDEKNRLTLPAKFRQAFKGGCVLTRGFDPCIYAYPSEQWQRLIQERLAALDPLSREARRLQQFFFSGAAEVELDGQGRVMIPGALLARGGLRKEVVVAGLGDRLELWDRAAWREQLKEVEGSVEDVAERLARHD
jgi:MraZ protein